VFFTTFFAAFFTGFFAAFFFTTFLGAAFLRATGLRLGLALTTFRFGDGFFLATFFLEAGFLLATGFATFFLAFFLVAMVKWFEVVIIWFLPEINLQHHLFNSTITCKK